MINDINIFTSGEQEPFQNEQNEEADNDDLIKNIKITFKVILVVDDILYIVKSIEKILRNSGYYVVTAQTGREALEKYEKYQPDLLTIDQKLPDMTGYQLVEKINLLNIEKKSKIIFISSVYEREEIKSILQLGVENYLLKPVTKTKLIETVNLILK